jgi:hypothetical protein
VNQSSTSISSVRFVRPAGRLIYFAIAVIFFFAGLCALAPVQASYTERRAAKGGCVLVLGAAAKRQRVVTFPKDYSLGELVVFPYPQETKDEGVRGAARGVIVVPPDNMVKFIPGPRYYKNPGIINTLPADGIDIIEFAALSLDDSEDGYCDRALSRVGHLKGLLELNLDRSDATDLGAVHAAELPNLQKITGQAAALEGKCFKQFAAMQHLRCIHLARNCLKDENLKYLGGLPKLEFLSIGHCNLSDAGIKNLANCTNLKLLSIGDNPKITDQSIKSLLCMKKLRFLDIHDTSITAEGVLQLKTLPLTRLDLPSSDFKKAQYEAIHNAFPGAKVRAPGTGYKSVDSDTDTIFAPLH